MPRPFALVNELQLTQKVLYGPLLLLERALVLVGSSLGLQVFVPRQGACGFLGAALGLVHCPLVLVFPAVPSHLSPPCLVDISSIPVVVNNQK